MPNHPRSERKTKNRVIALFMGKARLDGLGYRNLDDWHKRAKHCGLSRVMMEELLTGRIRLVGLWE